jgi:hypothetical protein
VAERQECRSYEGSSDRVENAVVAGLSAAEIRAGLEKRRSGKVGDVADVAPELAGSAPATTEVKLSRTERKRRRRAERMRMT